MMTTQETDRPHVKPSPRPGRTTPVEDLLSAALSLLIVLALYLDGRAHWLGLPDSFFTPWHALLYGGLVALGAWILFLGVRHNPDPSANPFRAALLPPRGYGFALIGAGVFAAGGVADGVWHTIFGIEEGIDALLSPSHLILFAGAALLFSGPINSFRASDASPVHRGQVRRVSLTLAVLAVSAVVAFALSYLSAFTTTAPTVTVGHYPEGTARHAATEMQASVGLASFLVTSLVLVLALTFLTRNGARVTGAVTLFVTVHATLSLMLVNYSMLGLGLILTAAAAGLSVDFALVLLARTHAPDYVEVGVIAALTPTAVVVSQVAALGATTGVRWSPELVGGILLLSALLAVGVLFAGTEPTTTRQARTSTY